MTRESDAPPGRAHRKIRNYLLEPRFQLRYAGLLAGTAAVLLSGLGGLVAWTARRASWESAEAAELATVASEQAERAYQESLASARIIRLRAIQEATDPAVARAMETELAQVNARGRAEIEQIQARRERARTSRQRFEALRARMTLLLAVGGVFSVLVLAGVGVVLTHKIVGPAYRMRRLFWRVSQGELTITERLREGDELMTLFEAFTLMVSALRAAHAADLAALDDVLDKLEKDQAEHPGTAKLREAMKRMRARRGPDERASDVAPSVSASKG